MKFDRNLNKRLSALDRGERLPTAETFPHTAPAHSAIRTVGESRQQVGPLDRLLPGTAVTVAEGEYWELRTPVAQFGAWAVEAAARGLEQLQRGRFGSGLRPAGNDAAAAVVFFDTETTGLNNEPLFLVGMLCHEGGATLIRQLLARDYSEEPAVLAEARRQMQQAQLVVSYNGLTFDVPYLQNRLRYHRLGRLELAAHLDLLPVARRKLGRSLGDCKLQTLERGLCHRERQNDIPGAQIPQAYHDFVADGEAGQLRRIVEHNSFDVITLAELAAHLSD